MNQQVEAVYENNRTNFGASNATIGGPVVGQISGTGAARIMQLGLKLSF